MDFSHDLDFSKAYIEIYENGLLIVVNIIICKMCAVTAFYKYVNLKLIFHSI